MMKRHRFLETCFIGRCQMSMIAAVCSFSFMLCMEKGGLPEISSQPHHQSLQHWIQVQDSLKTNLILEDDFTWKLPKPRSTGTVGGRIAEEEDEKPVLKYVGGVDVSFSKDDPSVACGTVVVLDIGSLEVVYDDYSVVRLQTPYVSGFLAFREELVKAWSIYRIDSWSFNMDRNLNDILFDELTYISSVRPTCIYNCASFDKMDFGHKKKWTFHLRVVFPTRAWREQASVLLKMLEKMKNNAHPFYPQLLMVDGNGLLHPRGFGLACHLGVLANIPTIGIGKTLHHVDGLTQSGVRELLEAKGNPTEDFIALTGYCGQTLGVAMRSTEGSSKPIFVSIGHRLSLDTSIAITKMTCKYRVPEPVRQADIRSRQYLQKHHQWPEIIPGT